MNVIRKGKGKPLLLVHGLGGSSNSWSTIMASLAKKREVIAVDLPGFGDTPPLNEKTTIASLSDALNQYLRENDLIGIDAVGSSMGARLVLELYRRGGILGTVVSLAPGGFWNTFEKGIFYTSISISIRLVRNLQRVMPTLTNSVPLKSLFFTQFSAHPWRLPSEILLTEMQDYARATRFDELLNNLVLGEDQRGTQNNSGGSLHFVWGNQDRVTFPSQATRAKELFPEAELHLMDNCGHFPHWDQPKQTVKIILDATSETSSHAPRRRERTRAEHSLH